MKHSHISREYLKDHYYEPYKTEISTEKLKSLRKQLSLKLEKPSVKVWEDPIETLSTREGDSYDFTSQAVRFGRESDLEPAEREKLMTALKVLMPWRKGPFDYYGIDVDAEWRSNLKWDRVAPWLPDLKNKKICDVGCNNEYYMYRMLPQDPWFVLGIDPMVRYFYHHRLNRKFYRDPRLNFDLLGVDDLELFPRFFDVIFFMGIIYHRRNPLQTMETLAQAMRPGGTLILESSGIPGDEPYCLFPEGRYMQAPGYWFLPTASALVNMLNRSGFHKVEVFDNFKLETHEQRQTDWAVFYSLEQFLDPDDPSKTTEGYPAPTRIYIRAVKK